MATFFLIISSILFISTFGIHSIIMHKSECNKPLYTENLILGSIPIICGFILPVIIFKIIFDMNVIIIFFINIVLVLVFGPMVTSGFLVRFASGNGLMKDMLTAFAGGLIALIIGLIIYNVNK